MTTPPALLARILDSARLALRRLRRAPGFAAIAVLCLAAGIGVAAFVFTLVDGLFLRPLPGVPAAERLVTVELDDGGSVPNYRDLRASTGSLAGLAAFRDELLGVRSGTGVERVLGLAVSGDYFSVLGTRPALGRLLGPADVEPGAPPAAVVSHGMWRRVLGGDSAAIGAPVRINGQPFTVVGVAPPGFVGIYRGFGFDVWVPLSEPTAAALAFSLEDRSVDRWQLVGRRSEGAGLEEVRSELAVRVEQLRRAHPGQNEGMEAVVRSYTGFDPDLRSAAVLLVAALTGIVVLVLLVATANVANMLLARSAVRAREVAMRRALGGGTLRAVLPLFLDGLLVSLLGAVGAVGVSAAVGRGLEGLVAGFPVRLALDLTPNAGTVAFALATALAVSLAVSVPALLQSARLDLIPALKGMAGPGGRSRVRQLLVVGQVTVSAVLLVTAGLFLRTLDAAEDPTERLEIESVYVAPFLDVSLAGVPESEGPALFGRVLEAVRGTPGVATAALTGSVPLAFTGPSTAEIEVPGRVPPPESEGFEVDLAAVSPGYFATLGLPIARGRSFEERDRSDARPVAIVNETLAERFWPEGGTVGRVVRLDGREVSVVGLVADHPTRALDRSRRPQLFVPHAQRPAARMSLLVRAGRGGPGVADRVRGAIRSVAPDLPVPDVLALERYLALSLVPQRLAARVGTAVGLLGLFLACIGVFGVVSFSVRRRYREIGIRAAVGAGRGDLLRLVVGRGLRIAGLGLLTGLPLAFVASRLFRGLLFGVEPGDPATYLAVGVALTAACLAGSWIPARRAAAVDPARVLRHE